jgi:YceI-like domain
VQVQVLFWVPFKNAEKFLKRASMFWRMKIISIRLEQHMKLSFFLLGLLFSPMVFAQSAVVDVGLTPAGSFKIKSTDVKGTAQETAGTVEAKNIVVGLKNIQTGISLRDTHTKKHLEVDKFPEATLISAKGKDGKGEGVIKIKGIQKNITGTYKIDGKNLIASFPLKLSDFKITDIKYMGVGVDDEVKLAVTVPIKKIN